MPRVKHRMPFVLLVIVMAVLITAEWICTSSQSTAGDQEVSLTATRQIFPEAGLDKFMQKKLQTINLAMEAASKDDFQGVEKAGLDLIQLSKDAAWNRRANAEYLQDTTDFIASARFMIRMAESKDPLGVAGSYSAVSACCLNCHRHVRSPKVAGNQDRHNLLSPPRRFDNAIASQ